MGHLLDDLPQHVELLPEDDRRDRPVTVLLTEEHLNRHKKYIPLGIESIGVYSHPRIIMWSRMREWVVLY